MNNTLTSFVIGILVAWFVFSLASIAAGSIFTPSYNMSPSTEDECVSAGGYWDIYYGVDEGYCDMQNFYALQFVVLGVLVAVIGLIIMIISKLKIGNEVVSVGASFGGVILLLSGAVVASLYTQIFLILLPLIGLVIILYFVYKKKPVEEKIVKVVKKKRK